MQRKSLVAVIVGVVGAIIVVTGAYAMWDASKANDEIDDYQSEIIDIQDQASKALPPSQLRVLASRLDDIRTELSYIPSRHRVASWFTDIQSKASDAMNEATSAETPINKRID
jgi:hypothetical protein